MKCTNLRITEIEVPAAATTAATSAAATAE